MSQTLDSTADVFAGRRRLLTNRDDVGQVARALHDALAANDGDGLRKLLDTQHPADLADAMFFLNEKDEQAVFARLTVAEAAEVLDEVDATTEANLVQVTSPDRLADILERLPPDEGADIVGGLSAQAADYVLSLTEGDTAQNIRTLLAYPKNTAGGIMTAGFVDVLEKATQADALQRFRDTCAEAIFYVYVVTPDKGLVGAVDLRRLLSADAQTPVRDLMTTDVITVGPACDQEQVAAIFARYDLTALPVVSDDARSVLLGVITADDVIDVLREENAEDVAHLTGTDAEELEKKSPAHVARLRLPWIMATLGIELIASLVIHVFDQTLLKYVLLASFMPVISAISGNTGLQSAAIIIRGLSTG